jgi:hypothetical protein
VSEIKGKILGQIAGTMRGGKEGNLVRRRSLAGEM